jgi:hypothetical protein
VVLAVGLAGAGCAGGDDDDVAAPSTRAPVTSSTTAMDASLQPEVDPAAGAGTAAPGTPTTVAVPVAARGAWRAWAGALARGDLAGATAASRDAANSWVIVLRVPAEAEARAGRAHTFSGTSRDGPALGGTADAVVLDAELVLTERGPGLERQFRVTRPVVRRSGGEWRVASLDLDGTPLRFSAPGLSRTTEDVTTELLAVLATGPATFAITRSAVPTGRDRALAAGPAALVDAGGARVPAAGSAFSADARPVAVWRFPPVVAIRSLEVTLLDGDRSLDFVFAA